MPNDNVKSYLHLHLIVFIWGFTAVLGALISLDAVPLFGTECQWLQFSFCFCLDKGIPSGSVKNFIGFIFAGLIITLHGSLLKQSRFLIFL